nr:MAG TPA: Rz lysis protein [Caudoviricetes sp.]
MPAIWGWLSSLLVSCVRRASLPVLTMLLGASVAAWQTHVWHEAREQRLLTKSLRQTLEAERAGREKAASIDRKYQAELRRLRAGAVNHTGGLYDRNASGTGHTIGAAGSATSWRLSDEAGGFLREEADRADELKAWADACWAYVQSRQ